MASKKRRSAVFTKVICAKCRMEIKEEDDDYIQCDKCSKKYHPQCTGLNKRQFEHFVNNESEEFLCIDCNEKGGTVKAELCEIKKQLCNNNNKLDQLQDSLAFMSQKFDELIRGVAENKKKIDAVQKENRILKNEIKELKDSVKLLNDQRVKNNCIISGVKAKDGTNAVDKLLEISKDVGLNLVDNEIESAYYLRKRNNSNGNDKQTMVVKFESSKSKIKLMQIKKKLKEKEETKSVFINDFLSKETLNIFKHAKTLKTIGYQAVYTYNGSVYAKRSEISKPRIIKSEEEVDGILMEATTSKFQKRRSNLMPAAVPDASNFNDEEEDEDGASFLSPA